MKQPFLIAVQDVCVGMFIQLDLSWLQHPFPVSSFRISDLQQVLTLQGLGLTKVRCIPARSDASVQALWNGGTLWVDDGEQTEGGASPPKARNFAALESGVDQMILDAEANGQSLAESLLVKAYDQRFVAATRQYDLILQEVEAAPDQALKTSSSLVAEYVAKLLDAPQAAIRLLSESVGEQQGAHPINVTILSLMLGKACGLGASELTNLGLAALLHDIGDSRGHAAPVVAVLDSDVDVRTAYALHVEASVQLAQAMGLPASVLDAIAQHHETLEGHGFPKGLDQQGLSVSGQIVALTNCYDRMCNPNGSQLPMTPHEALSNLFAQRRGQYRMDLVELFVRVMGVYPPGSLVQLNDGQYAMVVSVRSDVPLKPSVLLYQQEVPREEARVVDLAELPNKVIKRSLRPAQLTREVLDYLSPRKRVCYFFQRAVPLLNSQGNA